MQPIITATNRDPQGKANCGPGKPQKKNLKKASKKSIKKNLKETSEKPQENRPFWVETSEKPQETSKVRFSRGCSKPQKNLKLLKSPKQRSAEAKVRF